MLLTGMTLLQAEEFHPYQVKSGKIVFVKRKYMTKTHLHIDTNNHVTGQKLRSYFITDEIDYYWDAYGDLAYEVDYKLTDAFGKKLPKKIKYYEKLWKGNSKYFYKVKTGKVSKDPWHVKQECLSNGNFCKLSGWLKVLYPKLEKRGEVGVTGKKTVRYRIDSFSDLLVWKGIVLDDISYSTTPKGKRIEKESERKAIKVMTGKLIPSTFDPKWMKKY